MKRFYVLAIGLTVLGVSSVAVVAGVSAAGLADKPTWVAPSGEVDYGRMPDDAQVPYQCWSGKQIKLSGRMVKGRIAAHPKPGSQKYEQSIAKTKELRAIPGIVNKDASGNEIITIDDTNPQVQKIMKKYEAKETPQCQ